MMRVAITTPEVLKSLQARQSKLQYRDRAKPFNFVLMPIIDEFDGSPVGTDPKQLTLIAPFTSDIGRCASAPAVQVVVGDFSYVGVGDIALFGGAGWNTVPVAF
jgi:hypothetical protein